MEWTIAAIDRATGARRLLVEVRPDLGALSPDEIRPLCERLYRRNTRVGVAITPSETVVMRDTSFMPRFSESRFSRTTLDTDLLLRHAGLGPPRRGEAFVRQVETWLEAIAASWHSFLHESAVVAMVPHVVGRLVGANLERWDGLLEQHDAAE